MKQHELTGLHFKALVQNKHLVLEKTRLHLQKLLR